MAFTITVGAAAAAFGAGALGVGAIGLGALGLAALAGRGGGGKRHRRGHGYSHHGYRGRRDVTMVSSGDAETTIRKTEEDKKEALPLKKSADHKEQLILDEEQLLGAIRESDESGCSLRLVCELAGKDQTELTEDEWEILRFVSEGDPAAAPGQGLLPSSPSLAPYQSAARLGASGYLCRDVFKACDLNAAQIMGFVETLL